MPAGLLARVTSNLYREKAAQLQQQQQSSPSSESPSPSPPKEIVAVDFAQPKLPAAAYLDESSSSSYADPYATSPTLVLPDPADTLQFQALAIDRPPSPSVAQPAPAAYSASVKQQQQMSDPYSGIPTGLPQRAPPTPSSSSNGSIGSGSSYHSGPQQTADRNLSAALRGEYHPASKPNPPHPSSSHAQYQHAGYGTYSEPMSVDAPQPSPSYDSSAPPVPAATQAPTPASIAADQAAVAQAALRQAEQNARVAQIHAAAVAKTNAASGGNGAGEAVKIRKTAGKYALKDFEVARTLGTGSFGRVHLVKSRHNGRFYAVKVLGKEKVVRMKQVEHTNSEREMLVRVRHPFLVNLWGTFADPRNLYMVMDFVAGGELFSLLRKSQRFPNSVAKFYAAEVALAIDYLHSLDIIYRDLKPENILLGADGHVKVTDFGFAKFVPDITWTLCGTPDYLAPEVVQSKGYNKSVDWYALGVLIFEMLAGYPPFFTEDGNPMKLYEKIIAGKVRYPSYFDSMSKDLLKSLLTSDLTKRFGNLKSGSHDIFGHEWFGEVDWDRLYRRDIPAPYVPKIAGDGDTSQFDRYAECDTSEYGKAGPDPHGGLFPDF